MVKMSFNIVEDIVYIYIFIPHLFEEKQGDIVLGVI